MNGLVHIYCGDGKGKTTAAAGLAVRAAGCGVPVLIARFLKTDNSGEVGILKNIPGIRVLPCTREFGFTWNMDEEQRREAREYYSGQFSVAWESACALAEGRREAPGIEAGTAPGPGPGAAPSEMSEAVPGGEAGRAPDTPRALLVLDEIMAAVSGGFVSGETLISALDTKPEGLEVVLTGRNPSEALLKRADYVTEMRAVKHPYDNGINARKGIEY